MVWKPHTTVAAIVENQSDFLMVEEQTEFGVRINQPAGHLEPDESLLQAVTRETLEETGGHFEAEYLTGVYRWKCDRANRTYVRFCFSGAWFGFDPARPLDAGIIRYRWMSKDELDHCTILRSPLVLRCVQDYLAGHRYPLQLLVNL